MEFEDDDDLEEGREEEEEDEDDDVEGITIPPQTLVSSATTTADGERKSAAAPATRYRECQKNHAVSIGGHAVDGCGEFMPAGEDGTLTALKCAACGCHRNFHRKEIDTTPAAATATYPQFPPPQPPPTYHRRLLALPSTSGGRAEDVEELSNPSSSGGGGGSGRKKRFRTKFTAAQKEMMLAFADRVGWRIQKHDEAAVRQFCREAQVTRQVLKVWMHNNKHTLGRKP